jgi:hypothetical protein
MNDLFQFGIEQLSAQSDYTPCEAHEILAWYLLEAIMGRIPRLCISMCPQHGKSTWAYIALAYALGLDPHEMIMLSSYAVKFSLRGSRVVRRMVDSDPFVKRFGKHTTSLNRADEWQIDFAGGNNRPSFMAVGGKSPGTGQSVTLSLIDDLLNGPDQGTSPIGLQNAWETLTQGLLTRLQPSGRMVHIATRWALDDCTGRLQKQAEDNPKAVPLTVVNFTWKGEVIEWKSS